MKQATCGGPLFLIYRRLSNKIQHESKNKIQMFFWVHLKPFRLKQIGFLAQFFFLSFIFLIRITPRVFSNFNFHI